MLFILHLKETMFKNFMEMFLKTKDSKFIRISKVERLTLWWRLMLQQEDLISLKSC